MNDCPCGSGEALASCCRPALDGHPAPTAQALMRSRYSAFALGHPDHLWRTWHPRTRPAEVVLDPGRTWTGLQVLRTEDGGVGDDHGVVEFVASSAVGGRWDELRETSRFERRGGRWCYVDGEVSSTVNPPP